MDVFIAGYAVQQWGNFALPNTPWTGDRFIPGLLTWYGMTQKTRACMPRAEFEPATPVFERS